MKLTIPELSLVALIGPSGAGKSTFARKHFKPTEVLSSDFCRGLVSDDENSLAATQDAFDVLHYIAAKRLAAGRLTVVDATNVQVAARQPLVALAREHHCIPVAIVLNMPEKLCQGRNRDRPDRDFGPHVVRQHVQQLRRSLRGLEREGFRHVYVLSSPEDVEEATIERQPLRNNLRHEHGPFDVVGDVHGCFDELRTLLDRLGYVIERRADDGSGQTFEVRPPPGRKAIFLGDLVDRGPKTPEVLRLVMSMFEAGTALCVPGNHDVKLVRKLRGRNVQIAHGLAETLAQLESEPPEFKERVATFLDGLVSHYVLDDGKLVVAHAGMKEELQGRGSGRVRDFALYGETTGETDEFGLPVRYNWAMEYRGKAMVVYGHTPVPRPEWLNRTINLDTGCVFGGALTALRYPEKELVSVPAARAYAVPARPLLTVDDTGTVLSAQQERDDLLDLDAADFWTEFETDWACLDCELMPWSAKAQELLRRQYAAVGASSRAALAEAVAALEQATNNGADVEALVSRYRDRADMTARYVDAYRRYCWPVTSIADLKLAPFHLLATESVVHVDKNHEWHMQTLARVCASDPEVLLATPYLVVDLADSASREFAVRWWEDLTERGGEGMVVKPFDYVVPGRRGLAQPAVKCRGREYLRLIYGPEYTSPENLERLRPRGLGAKRSLALREFALGIEALERFVRGEPLRRVHECVFGVLALESEPVDPRL